jgi:hypothetical protein
MIQSISKVFTTNAYLNYRGWAVPSSYLVIKRLVEELPSKYRYSEAIASYYECMDMIGGEEEDNYDCALNAFHNLWLSSEKNSSLFEDARDFEPILSRSNQPYRDHFIHALNVFLLGYYIINKLNEIKPDNLYFRNNNFNVNLTWMLSSTFHDIAYPVQETEVWLNDLFDQFLGVNPKLSLNIAQLMPPIYNDFMRMISFYHQDPYQSFLIKSDFLGMDWVFYNDLSVRLAEKDHGVLASLMLCHRMAIKEAFLAQQTYENRDRDLNRWEFFYNHMPAGHAICLHTLYDQNFSFSKHPFAFLLILCDELQDWGRPSNIENKDCVNIKEINVDVSLNVPRLRFIIDASENKKENLKKVLDKRLSKSNINIEIY